ncbi:ccd4,nced4 [Orobanche gracilis]
MDILPSPFLQKYSSSSPPLLLIQFKPPSARININNCKSTTSKSSIGKTCHTSEESSNIITGKRNQSSVAKFFNSLEDLICRFIDPPLNPTVDPKIVLVGNFSPVAELPPTECDVVEGAIPSCLDGAYIRNGPNPQFVPRGPHHLFDGDGMLQCVRISNGGATFCSRFVKTYKYTVEREIGSPIFINYFSAFTSFPAALSRGAVVLGRVMSGQYNLYRGNGTANTSVACFGGKLFALGESDLPYRIKLSTDGDIITLGRHEDYGEPLHQMTAHPKIDKETGEAFVFRHNLQRPFLTYFRVDPDGIKQPEVNIFSKNRSSLVHDFAITRNYAVFPDSQILIRPTEIIKGNQPVIVDPTTVPRLGIIPRYAADEREMWWVEVPGFNMMHAVNAWEEEWGDTIVMVAPNLLAVENLMDRPELIHSSMERLEINVKTKTVTRRPISTRNLDFGVINPRNVGKKTRYIYATVGSEGPKMAAVVKLDLTLPTAEFGDCTVASRQYGPNSYGGEPCFIPREPDNPTAEEDDGYLVTYVHNEATHESKFLVMDAKSPILDIVAIVKMPQRVPYGFHGTFVRECDLQKL